MICFPNAKVNLGLSVIERRSDGMHNIETCFIPVPLFDVMEINPSKKFSLKQFGKSVPGSIDDNLITMAWDRLIKFNSNIQPVEVCLFKAIPIGSGLGGGSSDAAFFLSAVNSLYSLRIPDYQLENIANDIGADCPFFISNQPALATGTGNLLTHINNPAKSKIITLVFPCVSISTKDAYSRVEPAKNNPLSELITGNISEWKNTIKNDFEDIIFNDHPDIARLKKSLYNLGACYVSLSGSGSVVFALSNESLNLGKIMQEFEVWTGILS